MVEKRKEVKAGYREEDVEVARLRVREAMGFIGKVSARGGSERANMFKTFAYINDEMRTAGIIMVERVLGQVNWSEPVVPRVPRRFAEFHDPSMRLHHDADVKEDYGAARYGHRIRLDKIDVAIKVDESGHVALGAAATMLKRVYALISDALKDDKSLNWGTKISIDASTARAVQYDGRDDMLFRDTFGYIKQVNRPAYLEIRISWSESRTNSLADHPVRVVEDVAKALEQEYEDPNAIFVDSQPNSSR